jgi:hypothetical protein
VTNDQQTQHSCLAVFNHGRRCPVACRWWRWRQAAWWISCATPLARLVRLVIPPAHNRSLLAEDGDLCSRAAYRVISTAHIQCSYALHHQWKSSRRPRICRFPVSAGGLRGGDGVCAQAGGGRHAAGADGPGGTPGGALVWKCAVSLGVLDRHSMIHWLLLAQRRGCCRWKSLMLPAYSVLCCDRQSCLRLCQSPAYAGISAQP